MDAPPGVKPICWVLLTSLAVATFDDAWQVVEDYENRWLVEEYHKVMKSGCSLEMHALRSADRLEPLIGLISVIGVRLIQLKLIGRNMDRGIKQLYENNGKSDPFGTIRQIDHYG